MFHHCVFVIFAGIFTYLRKVNRYYHQMRIYLIFLYTHTHTYAHMYMSKPFIKRKENKFKISYMHIYMHITYWIKQSYQHIPVTQYWKKIMKKMNKRNYETMKMYRPTVLLPLFLQNQDFILSGNLKCFDKGYLMPFCRILAFSTTHYLTNLSWIIWQEWWHILNCDSIELITYLGK